MANSVILKDLISYLELSTRAFESKIGVGGSAIAKAIERNSKIKDDTIDKIVKAYPDVNRDWLVTGNGEMMMAELKLSSPKEVIQLGKQTPSKLKPEDYSNAFAGWGGLPMYNMPITASFIETYRDSKELAPQYYMYDPRFRDCNFGAIITGDSMHSEIRHGDFVVCKEITDTSFIVYGDIYYVVATNGLETCKYVNSDPKNDNNLLLVPRNEKISPSPIAKDMILKMFKVRGIVRGY